MFRFSIRDVLWLTTVAALALGWAIDRSRLAQSNSELTRHRNRVADTKAQLVVQRERLQLKLEETHSTRDNAP
jgi:hypothetical protein